MGTTSNESKQRWNDSHYSQVKVSVPQEVAALFKARCIANEVSMASEISKFMNEKIARPTTSKDLYATRQKRRKALKELISKLEAIRDAEQRYQDNFPENLQNSPLFEAAGQAASAMNEALELLCDAY